MRRSVAAWGICTAAICAVIGCGLDVMGTQAVGIAPGDDAAAFDADLPSLDGPSGREGGADAGDGAGDAPGPDAELTRPDAGVPFVPSHILPVYSLGGSDVEVTVVSNITIDTTNRTIAVGVFPPAVSSDIVISNGIAVWSVGSFKIDQLATLTVTGANPLVIVAARDVTIDGTVSAGAKGATPGPGGLTPSMGAGMGRNGNKSIAGGGTIDASGGGGAGHATAGGAGGVKNLSVAGPAGPLSNPNDLTLVGGSGGGNGGNYVPGGCGVFEQGIGGGGGGAIQISSVGAISITRNGTVDVSGGGGSGGCGNGGTGYSGGGGGGAGGLVVLEAVRGVTVANGAHLVAGGGGGGEGGHSTGVGKAGDDGQANGSVANGGSGFGSGGDGGDGGDGKDTGSPMLPQDGKPDPNAAGTDSSGGGGASTGRLFVGARVASDITVDSGAIHALRVNYVF